MTTYTYQNSNKSSILMTRDDGTTGGFANPSVGNTDYEKMIEDDITPTDYVAPDATMASIRGERNQLLKNTDWQAGTDVTMSDAQTAYRKKLRDLPATNSDPTKIVFPDAP